MLYRYIVHQNDLMQYAHYWIQGVSKMAKALPPSLKRKAQTKWLPCAVGL